MRRPVVIPFSNLAIMAIPAIMAILSGGFF
jgi:hypothetical protein